MENNEFCFSISYIELDSTLETCVNNFKMIEESTLEQGIISYQEQSKRNGRLVFFEPELDSQEERDVPHDVRPKFVPSYLFFSKKIHEESIQEIEKEWLSLAETIRTNAFFLLNKKAPFAVFLKKDSNWYWLPAIPYSFMPKMKTTLLPFGEINEGEEFFTTFLKT